MYEMSRLSATPWGVEHYGLIAFFGFVEGDFLTDVYRIKSTYNNHWRDIFRFFSKPPNKQIQVLHHQKN